MTLADFGALAQPELRMALSRCCGAERWVQAVMVTAPWPDRAALDRCCGAAFAQLERPDWLAAFSHHPRIGERSLQRAAATGTQAWSAQEQAGAASAASTTLDALRAGNEAYEARFGHVYLVCATGRSADELLAFLHERLCHDAPTELAVAAAEQRKITGLRLDRLLDTTAAEALP